MIRLVHERSWKDGVAQIPMQRNRQKITGPVRVKLHNVPGTMAAENNGSVRNQEHEA